MTLHNGTVTEVKRTYKVVNCQAVVVWDIGEDNENLLILTYEGVSSVKIPAIEESSASHKGTIDWGDGTTGGYSSAGVYTHSYTSAGNYTVKIDCPIEAIKTSAFALNATAMTKVSFPSSVKTVGYKAFYYHKRLKEINFSSVEEVKPYSFQYCKISALKGIKIKRVGEGAFKECSNLKSVSLQSCEKIGADAFEFCSSLTEIEIPLTRVLETRCFASCKNLAKIAVTENLKYVYGETGQSTHSLFNTQWLNERKNQGEFVYLGKVYVDRGGATVPEFLSFRGDTTGIAAHSWASIPGIKSVSIPDGVEILAPYTFASCKNLAEVEISLSSMLKRIDEYFFSNSKLIKSLYIPSTIEWISPIAFSNTEIQTITINKPQDSITGAPWGAPADATIVWTG